MLLPTKDGIMCDLCKSSMHKQFTYYSMDCHKVTVDVTKASTSREEATGVDGSVIGFDICEKCMKSLTDKALEKKV